MYRRNSYAASAVALAILASNVSPAAANQIDLLQSSDTDNSLQLSIAGDENVLTIEQFHDGNGGLNQINLEIAGNSNGGGVSDWFHPLSAAFDIAPGSLVQDGHDNLMDLHIYGSDNLFAAAQYGSNNTIAGTITGSENQVAAIQAGTGNMFSFSQTGTGNSIAVYQKSW